jgi:hypothetical protein
MAEGHRSGRNDWSAIDGRDGHSGIVNDAIDDLLAHFGLQSYGIGGHGGHFPSELFFARKPRLGRMHLHMMNLHFGFNPSFASHRTCTTNAVVGVFARLYCPEQP